MARTGHALFTELIEFVGAHDDVLTPHEIFIIGAAAGIIDRVMYPDMPAALIDVELPTARPE